MCHEFPPLFHLIQRLRALGCGSAICPQAPAAPTCTSEMSLGHHSLEQSLEGLEPTLPTHTPTSSLCPAAPVNHPLPGREYVGFGTSSCKIMVYNSIRAQDNQLSCVTSSLTLVSWRSKNMAKGELSCLFCLGVCWSGFWGFFFNTLFYLKEKTKNSDHTFLWDYSISCGIIQCSWKWVQKGPDLFDL